MNEKQSFNRFDVLQRIEHVVLLISFTLLGITGLAQKFPLADISAFITNLFGGIETMRIVHRVNAIIFVVQSVYHFSMLGYKLFVQRKKPSMAPSIQDAKDAIQAVLYNLGFSKIWPKMGHFTFGEKAEYLAVVWGLIVMGATGFMMWNPIATVSVLPGVVIPAAKAAHGAEAILAVLAILIWHFYGVHLRHLNKSMLNGKMTREEMEDEHGRELEEIESGKVEVVAPPAVIRKRKTIFFPVVGVFSIAALAFVYWFLSFQPTAIATIPPIPEQVTPYAPVTATPAPVKPTPEPQATKPAGSAPLTWNTGISKLFQNSCGGCHGAAGGLDTSTYASLMKGGSKGAVIIPGDPDNSSLVQLQKGSHPGLFLSGDLTQIIDWIKAGALEK